jgi:hypothetical protein
VLLKAKTSTYGILGCSLMTLRTLGTISLSVLINKEARRKIKNPKIIIERLKS